jgi:hypothetical protein
MLLECVSRTFAHRFSIYTATTREGCRALLRQTGFDLTVISEKLADGPGLALLGQIARDSPDTRRVFCARRSRLQLLKGKLGPFGLFRTLDYPIVATELLATLVLARAGLEPDAPVLELPRGARRSRTVPIVRAASRVTELPAVTSSRVRKVARDVTRARAVVPKSVPVQSRPAVFQHAAKRREPVNTPLVHKVVPRPAQHGHMGNGSVRPNLLLVATMVGVFLMTLTLNAPRTYRDAGSDDAPPLEMRRPDSSATPLGTGLVSSMPVLRPAPVARRLEARPVATQGHMKPAAPQVVASASPIADPSTFGSEAYEAIYPN